MKRIRRRFIGLPPPTRIVGYLKTLALHRIIDWVEPEDLMGLQGFKEGQRDKPHLRSTLLDYCGVKETEVQRLEIDYDRTRHGGIDIPRLKRIVSKYGKGASVCTGLAYLVRKPDIDIQIYDRGTGSPLRKEKSGPLVTIWEPFTIHLDSPEMKDSEFIKNLREINQEDIGEYGFKLGTLDLVKVTPVRDWGLKRKRYIDATTRSRDEIIKLQEPLKTDLKSRRLYRMTSTNTWELVGW